MEVYVTKFQLLMGLIVSIFVTIIIILSILEKQPKSIFEQGILFLVIVLIWSIFFLILYAYRKKIPIYKVK